MTDPIAILINKVLTVGHSVSGRNGATITLLDEQIKYDLSAGFPIVTGRRIFWKGVVEELLWILRGQTDSKILEAKGINIWKPNSTTEFLRTRGLPYVEGDIGPGYGFQLRHFGGIYTGSQNIPAQKYLRGVDQLAETLWSIKHDPYSRRHFVSLWNPEIIDKMALPPCHISYQFNVRGSPDSPQTLCCHLYQRSWDITTGWNTTTAALLTHIVAHICGLGVGILTHSVSNIHIYQANIEAAKELVGRKWPALPQLTATLPPIPAGFWDDKEKIGEHLDNYLASLSFEMFFLDGYKPLPTIRFEMVA
jgi:thymidylate synthase